MNRKLEPGELFDIKGYELVASAKYVENEGEVIVLNNNSTHYLVAVRPGDADDMAQFETSFRYYAEDEADDATVGAYREALRTMILLAVSR